MGKTKSAQPEKATKSNKDAQVKSLSSVKEGAITKPSQTSKSKSKEMAKQVAVKAEKAGKPEKKSKKVKEPTPVSSSEIESGDEEMSSSSSASSDGSESEAPAPKQAAKINGAKTNGVAKAATEAKAESSDSSNSSDEEDDEGDEPAIAASASAAAAKEVKAAKESEDDSEEGSEEDSENESDEEVKVAGPIDAKALNGELEKVASGEASSEDESGSDETSSGTSEGSSSEDESDEESAPAPNKRKAETEAAPAAKKTKTEASNESNVKNLFVGHLSYNVDEEWLTREFEKYGELAAVRIITDRETGRSKGFGYVDFVHVADAAKAQDAMHETEIDGRAINVDFSKPKDAPRQDRKKAYGDTEISPASDTIFVANLSFEVTEDAVGEEFGKHGNVLGVRLPTDMDSGNPKGFGYVQFGSVEEAQDVFGKMAGAVILGRPVRLDYSTPRPPRNGDSPRGRGGRGGFDRGGRGGGRGGRGGFDRGGRGGGRGRGGFDRGGRGGSTNRGGFGDFQGKKMTF